MPSASILTMTSNRVVSAGSPTTINMIWDVETKYLDQTYDHFDAGTDDTALVIPASMDGEIYEVFSWVEGTAFWSNGGGGGYLGMTTNAPNSDGDYWGIWREMGWPARGARSGPVQADSTERVWRTPCREFEGATMTMDQTRCRFGILVGQPRLIGIASAETRTFSAASGTLEVVDAPAAVNPQGIYNPVNGVYTVPEGATLAVPTFNSYQSTATSSADIPHILKRDGVEENRFYHSGSLRGPGPGTFGLLPVTPGEEFTFEIDNQAGAVTYRVHTGMEFY